MFCILFLFLSFCRFWILLCFSFALVGALVDVPLIFFCPADHVRTGLLLFFSHYNQSGLNHTQYYTWLPIRYVVSWTERDQRNIYQAPMCVCVFFPSILDIKFIGRTSRGHTGGRSHRIFNPPSFCGACLDFCREKDSAIPFPRRP